VPLPRLPNPLGTRVRVPLRLGPITTVDDEVAPEEVGLAPRAVNRITRAMELLYRTGLHPGVSLVVRHRGLPVVNRAIGHRLLGGEALMTPTTPACLFSCSKAITALVIHKLAEDGVVGLDDRVAEHLPAFAANGKAHVTVRDLLTHRAGLARIPLEKPDPMILFDVEAVLDALCRAPLEGYSRQAYHAVTSGYVLGAVAEQASGRGLRTLLADLVAPLDCPTVGYGVVPERRDEAALSYTTGATNLPVLKQAVGRLIGLEPQLVAPAMNAAIAAPSVLPAAGMWAGASDVAKIFQMLVDGGAWNGRQVLERDTVAEAVRPAGPLVMDATLPAPIRFSAGFMLGEPTISLYGVNTARAFGHLGYTNVLCWADPDRHLAAALLTTGKSIAPEGFLAMMGVAATITASVPVAPSRARSQLLS
jgi:CubicO group peptidase (beta-lactamase class C family)